MMGQTSRRGRETIFRVLKKDHQRVLDLFAKLEKETEPDLREDFLADIESELHVHMALEEDIFYRALRGLDFQLVAALCEGHSQIRDSLTGFLDTAGYEAIWMNKVQKLKNDFWIHIQVEEERLFALARKILQRKEPFKIGQFFLRERRLQMGISFH